MDEHEILESALIHSEVLAQHAQREAQLIMQSITSSNDTLDAQPDNTKARPKSPSAPHDKFTCLALEDALHDKGFEHSENVYLRIHFARQGLFADYLKEDPIDIDRLEVLRSTSKFFSHYREREDSPMAIPEFIRHCHIFKK